MKNRVEPSFVSLYLQDSMMAAGKDEVNNDYALEYVDDALLFFFQFV